MKKYFYEEIKNVIVSDNDVVEVMFNKTELETVMIDGELDEDSVYQTKEAVMEACGNIVLSGCGKRSGRKLWNAGRNINRQVKKAMKKRHVK